MSWYNAPCAVFAVYVILISSGSASLFSNVTNDTMTADADESFLRQNSSTVSPFTTSIPHTSTVLKNVNLVNSAKTNGTLSVFVPLRGAGPLQLLDWKEIETEEPAFKRCGQKALCEYIYASDRKLAASVNDKEMINYYKPAMLSTNWLDYLNIAPGPNDMTNKTFQYSLCYCDPSCAKYGDCCQDAAGRWNRRPEDLSRYLSCRPLDANALHYKDYFLKCPSNYSDKTVVSTCENPESAVPREAYSYAMDLPVLSKKTNLTYANVYCARCHNDMDLVNWKLTLACDLDGVVNMKLSDLVRGALYEPGNRTFTKWVNITESGRVWQHHTKCIVTAEEFQDAAKYAKNTNGRRCLGLSFVQQCDPNWANEVDHAKCSAYSLHMSENGANYKNPHCARCNYVRSNSTSCHRPEPKGQPLSLLFDPSYYIVRGGEGSKREVNPCSENEFWDHLHERCHAITCGYRFENINGVCTPKESHSKIYIKSHINSTCPRITVQPNEFLVLPNDSVYINKTKSVYDVGNYETNLIDETIQICGSHSAGKLIAFDNAQTTLSNITLTISIICLALHIIIHLLLPKLRNLPGKNLLSLSCALFFAQLLFITGIDQTDHEGICVFFGVSIHWFFLAAFFWMSVMSFDICRTFSNRTFIPISNKNSFKYYSLYAWGIPTIIVSFALLLDFTTLIPAIEPSYGNRNGGERICWINNRPGFTVFFLVPISILLCENCVFYGVTVRGIYAQIQMARLATRSVSKPQRKQRSSTDAGTTKRSSLLNSFYSQRNKLKDSLLGKTKSRSGTTKVRNHNEKRNKIRFILYVKLSVIMGLGWLFGFIAALAKVGNLWYLFIAFNGLQGAFIFLSFDMKRKIFYMLWEKITGKPHPQASQGSSRKLISSSGATRTTNAHRRRTSEVTDTDVVSSDTTTSQRSKSSKEKQIEVKDLNVNTNYNETKIPLALELDDERKEIVSPVFTCCEDSMGRPGRKPRERTRSVDAAQTDSWSVLPVRRLRSSSLQCSTIDGKQYYSNKADRSSSNSSNIGQPITPKRQTERKERLSLLQMHNRTSSMSNETNRPRRSLGSRNEYESPGARVSRSSKV